MPAQTRRTDPVESAEPAGPDAVDIHVGQRLKQERVAQGMTQSQLGGALGVTFQQIQTYERGTNRVSASMLVRAARCLNVPVGVLFPPDDPWKETAGLMAVQRPTATQADGRRKTRCRDARPPASFRGDH
ncbi:helix-turn-helix domain-containing protein [Brevundimonas diminuta]|nr:helix-turn-helix transcriptional regulator [Brevundimonas diminuta]